MFIILMVTEEDKKHFPLKTGKHTIPFFMGFSSCSSSRLGSAALSHDSVPGGGGNQSVWPGKGCSLFEL